MGRQLEMTPEERAALIRQGYKPVEIWVPDIESETYRKEAARQAEAAVEADKRSGIVELVDCAAVFPSASLCGLSSNGPEETSIERAISGGNVWAGAVSETVGIAE